MSLRLSFAFPVAAVVLSVAGACTSPNPSYKTDEPGGSGARDAAMGQGGMGARTGGASGIAPNTGGAGGSMSMSMSGSGGIPAPDAGSPDEPPSDSMPNPSVDLLTGLVGYWRMDEAGAATVVPDSSGLHNDGTLESVAGASSWVSGRFGSALHFTDNDRRLGVRVPATARIAGLTRYTLAAWVRRLRSRPLAYQGIISRQLGTGIAEVFDMSISKDVLMAYGPDRNDQGVTTAAAGQTAPIATWFHAAATYDGEQLRIYQDGALTGAIAQPRPLPSATTPLYLGTNKNNASTSDDHHPMEGDLDEVLLYEVALPGEAIAALARGERPPVP